MFNIARDRDGYQIGWKCKRCGKVFEGFNSSLCPPCRYDDKLLNEISELRKQLEKK